MRIVYVGTHEPMTDRGTPWTTETAWGATLELLGHEVIRIDEASTSWPERIRLAADADLFLITSTWGYEERQPRAEGFRAVRYLNDRMPTAMIHLDKWFGLGNREHQIRDSPQFKVRFCFTADGDSSHQFEAEGIRHFYLPPGVFAPECVPGVPRDEWRADVGFVGNRDYGHREHAANRMAMLDTLAARYGDRLALWPRPGESGPWGLDFNDLLSSIKVVVGDSWQGAVRYFSNRAMETIGRGGFCVHPAVPGLVEMLPEGMGVAYFPPGDWQAMCEVVDRWVADDDGRDEACAKGRLFVRDNHSYTNRMQHMLDVMAAEGAFR